ncbi:MAG TPA: hypothetical protein VFY28_02170 [Candidatus Paceibacterota bacterium]|nr:hypothetical protein [Candidatus Paceibacterota bacterium]
MVHASTVESAEQLLSRAVAWPALPNHGDTFVLANPLHCPDRLWSVGKVELVSHNPVCDRIEVWMKEITSEAYEYLKSTGNWHMNPAIGSEPTPEESYRGILY